MSALQRIETGFARWQFRSNMTERRKLYRKLAVMVRNGVPLYDAVKDLQARYERRGKGHPFAIALREWVRRMGRDMEDLASATRGWVPEEERMLFAGADDLAAALELTVEVMDAKKRIRKTIIEKSIGPALMVLVAFGVMFTFATKVIPQIKAAMPKGFQLHGLAATVDSVSTAITHWAPLIVVVLMAMAVIVSWSVSNLTGSFRDKVLNRVPPWSVYKAITGVIWMISTSALLKKGADMKAVLQEQIKMAPPWLKKELQTLYTGALRGQTIDQVMVNSGRNFPDEEVVDDIAIYSRTSGFSNALITLAREWIEEVEESVKQKMALINTGALMFMSGAVLFFGLGLFAIINQVTEAARQM